MERYEDMLVDSLRLDRAFLDKYRRRIRGRLLGAYHTMAMARRDTDPVQDEISATNECLYLAGSVVLLGSDDVRITRTLQDIKENEAFSDVDPTIILIACALRYILKDQEQDSDLKSDQRKKLEHIVKRFERMNWVVGTGAVAALGLNQS